MGKIKTGKKFKFCAAGKKDAFHKQTVTVGIRNRQVGTLILRRSGKRLLQKIRASA